MHFRRMLSMLLIAAMSLTFIPVAGAETFEAFLAGETAAPAESESTVTEPSADASSAESSSGVDLEAADTSALSDYPTLKPGDVDVDGSTAYIVVLQARLLELGFMATRADGQYGPGTEAAVRAFQSANGLEVTGIADAATQQKIYSDDSEIQKGTVVDTSAVGSDAARIQTRLAQWGFLASGKADGVLGDASKKAIKDFKSYAGTFCPPPTPEPTATPEPTPEPTKDPDALPVRSYDLKPTPEVPAEQTMLEANSEVDDTLMGYVNDTYPFVVYRQDVQSGDNGIEVTRVQNRLRALNYLYDNDGSFGITTARALMYFQRKNGLTESGIADEETQRLLYSQNAQPSEEYVFQYKYVIDISEQRVYAYEWDGSSYSKQVRKMVCSTGKNATPTPKGTFQASGPSSQGEWYYFKEFNCYAKWATRIVGGILFHSVTFSKSKKLNTGAVRHLGTKASHGCIRLSIEDAEWIYNHCPSGTTVVVQE